IYPATFAQEVSNSSRSGVHRRFNEIEKEIAMKKSVTLALALVALAVFSGVGLAQRKGEEKKPAAATVMEHQALQQQVNKLTQTAFTYQGQLKEGSVPANGTYTFRFAL